MRGWKGYFGAAVVAVAAGLHAAGYAEYASAIEAVGLALGVTGIRAKMERQSPGQ